MDQNPECFSGSRRVGATVRVNNIIYLKFMDHMEMARKGENAAEELLLSSGFQILERNWYHKHKELDIIAIDESELVIIEVKSRRAPALDNPAMSICRKKQRNLVYAANAYVRMKRISLEIRFDVMWVIYHGNKAEIEHIRNAFVPGLY